MPGEGESLSPEDAERLGDPSGMDETDDRMMGDSKGPTAELDDREDLAPHLRDEEDGLSLGDPVEESLQHEIRDYLMQEGPAGAGMVDPTDARGAYTPFDMNKDHMGTDDLSATWYRSPGRQAGADGDPYRGEDPHAQLGFHPPKQGKDPVASPPAADGEEGVAARRTPPIWQLSAGSDTSKILGANVTGPSSDAGPEGQGDENQAENPDEGEGSTHHEKEAEAESDEIPGQVSDRDHPSDR